MDGWNPWKNTSLESTYHPSWDVYSLGVSIWEILTNGETPPQNQALPFDFPLPEDDAALQLKKLAERCLADDPKERPALEQIYQELGGSETCGCKESI